MRTSMKLRSVLGLVFIALIILTPITFAETKLLAPIPGQPNAGKDLNSYLTAIFTYGIGLVALLALAQLIFGAVQYTASAGAPSLQEDAKGRMRNAIIGLVLLLLSVSILVTLKGGTGSDIKTKELVSSGTPANINTLKLEAYYATERLTEAGILNRPENTAQTGYSENFMNYFMNPLNVHWYDAHVDKGRTYTDPDLDLLRTELEQMQDMAESASSFENEQQQQDYQKMYTYIVTKIKSGAYTQGSEGDEGGIIIGTTPPKYGLTPEKLENVLKNINPKYIRSDLIGN